MKPSPNGLLSVVSISRPDDNVEYLNKIIYHSCFILPLEKM
jgi:hypothetical protein